MDELATLRKMEMGIDFANQRRRRRPWGWQSNTSKKARQNAALRYLESLERPIANAHPVHDAEWIGLHAGRIQRTRAWQAIQNDETGEALYTDWDAYCYFRWGRTGWWFAQRILQHERAVAKKTSWHLASDAKAVLSG